MLTAHQIATLRAARDRIIPQDDYPAAWDAGAGDYIQGQLRGDLADLLPTYIGGLECLNGECSLRYGHPFPSASPAEQNATLRAVESGDCLTDWTVSATAFFRLLVDHTMEGYYSDPSNGGNAGCLSWRMIGFTPAGWTPEQEAK